MNKKLKRLEALTDIIKNKNGLTIKTLSSILNISEMTVRRDLEVLKEREIALIFNGVIMYNNKKINTSTNTYLLALAVTSNIDEKSIIGKYAASLIEENDCVIIDNGSTVEYLARNISKDINIMVLTFNLNVVNEISRNPNISIVFGGGYYHPDTSLFESVESISLINKTRANKVFISAAGVHQSLGVTCSNNYEIETKKTILRLGAENILLVDSSKFGIIKPFFFADIKSFNKIITDSGITDDWIKIINDLEIELIIL